MDRGAWWTAVHGVAKNRTQLSDFTFTFLSLEAYTNHWTNLRRAEPKWKKEFNIETWGKGDLKHNKLKKKKRKKRQRNTT